MASLIGNPKFYCAEISEFRFNSKMYIYIKCSDNTSNYVHEKFCICSENVSHRNKQTPDICSIYVSMIKYASRVNCNNTMQIDM